MSRKYRRSHRKPCSPGNKKLEQGAQLSCYVFIAYIIPFLFLLELLSMVTR